MAKNENYVEFNNVQRKTTIKDFYGRELKNSDLNTAEYHKIKASVLKHNIKYGTDSATHRELEGLKPTLGFEIETVKGRIPKEEYIDLNINAEHDGSLRDAGQSSGRAAGGEYVTGVLYGDAGFAHLYKICKVLQKNCVIDGRAGVHVHIGSLDWTKEDIVYSYILAQAVEKEMYSMLPASRMKNEYCRKITKLFSKDDINLLLYAKNTSSLTYESMIDKYYNKVFMEASGGVPMNRACNTNTNHPRGSKCGWNKKSQRYCWLNYVTLLFNTKDNPNAKTLEIRSHSATMKYTKIKNWAKIWVAFTEFVNKYKDEILENRIIIEGKSFTPTLETICRVIYPKTGSKLIKYIQDRKLLFKTEDETIDFSTEDEPDVTMKELLEISN